MILTSPYSIIFLILYIQENYYLHHQNWYFHQLDSHIWTNEKLKNMNLIRIVWRPVFIKRLFEKKSLFICWWMQNVALGPVCPKWPSYAELTCLKWEPKPIILHRICLYNHHPCNGWEGRHSLLTSRSFYFLKWSRPHTVTTAMVVFDNINQWRDNYLYLFVIRLVFWILNR